MTGYREATGKGAMEGRRRMERIAITQEETRWASWKKKKMDMGEVLNIAPYPITSVDVISRRLLISVPSP